MLDLFNPPKPPKPVNARLVSNGMFKPDEDEIMNRMETGDKWHPKPLSMTPHAIKCRRLRAQKKARKLLMQCCNGF